MYCVCMCCSCLMLRERRGPVGWLCCDASLNFFPQVDAKFYRVGSCLFLALRYVVADAQNCPSIPPSSERLNSTRSRTSTLRNTRPAPLDLAQTWRNKVSDHSTAPQKSNGKILRLRGTATPPPTNRMSPPQSQPTMTVSSSQIDYRYSVRMRRWRT